jgi:methionyl aminopeptidase
MSMTKTPEEIEKLARGGALLSRALKAACDAVKPGAVVRDLDAIAEKVIVEGGGEPSFKGYGADATTPAFPSTMCVSVNEEIVHGLGDRNLKLKEGDIVGLDIGCWFEGLCTDMAVTLPVGKVSAEATKLIAVTRESLEEAVKAAKVGGLISDIGAAVERVVNPHGYGIVRALVGHGVGHEVHEAPHVPNYTDAKYPKVPIVDGMVIAIEPMIGLGGHKVKTGKDGWAVLMADGKIGAHFEVSVACTKQGTKILTPLPV